MYIRITSTKSPSFCMTAFSASLTIPVVLLPVTWLQLLRKQTNTDISTALHKHTDLRAHDFAHPPDLRYQPSIVNVTCVWSWRLCGINPAIHLCLYNCVHLRFSGNNFMCKFHISVLSYIRYCLQSAILIRPQSLFFQYVKEIYFQIHTKQEVKNIL